MRPHRQKPTRLRRPWDSPGKNTGVGCHVLLQCMKVKSQSEVAQSCPTLRDPMDCSLPGSSVHGIFQPRVLEWGAIAFNAWRCELRQIRRTACVKLTGRFLIRTWHLKPLLNGWSHSGHVPMPPALFENHKLLRLELAWVEASLESLWGSQLEGKAHLAWLLQRKDFVGACNVTSLLMGTFSLLSLDCILCYHKS